MIRILAGKSFQPGTKDKKRSFGMCTLTVTIREKFFGYNAVAPLILFHFLAQQVHFFSSHNNNDNKNTHNSRAAAATPAFYNSAAEKNDGSAGKNSFHLCVVHHRLA